MKKHASLFTYISYLQQIADFTCYLPQIADFICYLLQIAYFICYLLQIADFICYLLQIADFICYLWQTAQIAASNTIFSHQIFMKKYSMLMVNIYLDVFLTHFKQIENSMNRSHSCFISTKQQYEVCVRTIAVYCIHHHAGSAIWHPARE